MHDVDAIRKKFEVMSLVLDERQMRLWAATEADALGRGGQAAVTEATGIHGPRIRNGLRDIEELRVNPPDASAREQRVRRPGAGRKPITETDPALEHDLDRLIDPATRGDPESPLRWTSKSLTRLTEGLGEQGHDVSPNTVRRLLLDMGYSLQAPRKTQEGEQHLDRDAQFRFIAALVAKLQQKRQPVISVDAKKKELVGDFHNGGREWQPKGDPDRVRVHDFIDKDLGKAIPYGVYDVGRNEGWVGVGIDHDTAEFAVGTILQWWRTMGRKVYPDAKELLITADAGGSNATRSRLWKLELQRLADAIGLRIRVCHYPPGTSKWNKIEHRLFAQISKNWRGRPLESVATIVQLIGATTSTTGLKVRAAVDNRSYPTGTKVTDAQLMNVKIKRDDFHGDWNYAIVPS